MERNAQLKQLKEQTFDILVIGGGATGAGVALDAATRGLKVALVERDDFAAGTSSRSTKLIHGGVRYLEQAVKKLDRTQWNLVKDALKERSLLLKLAPHLSHPLPLLTPLYSYWGIPYFLTGLKMYGWLAGKRNLRPSQYLSCDKALKNFPMLKPKGLRGGVLYYDGQFDDARMNISIALTAAEQGAVVLNHVEVIGLLKEKQKLCGAKIRDAQTDQEWEIKAKIIINATGPFGDHIRHLDDPKAKPLLKASSGIHIVLDKRFSPPSTGLLIPETEDGRVLFLLPWLGHTLVGTTDNPAKIEDNPKASEADIRYILRHIKKYFNIPVTRQDVQASWCGLRPLVSDPKAADTARLSRDHFVEVSAAGLLTISGGKWTTYRKMALDTVDHAVRVGKLRPKKTSQTQRIPLRGAEGYSKKLAQELVKKCSLDPDVAEHLAQAYGGKAWEVIQLSESKKYLRLDSNHPYLETEVRYAVQKEMALSVVDVLARRIRLAFLDSAAAEHALPRVLKIMGQELGWNKNKLKEEEEKFFRYLHKTPETSSPKQKSA